VLQAARPKASAPRRTIFFMNGPLERNERIRAQRALRSPHTCPAQESK
jgi:hypothetical protein